MLHRRSFLVSLAGAAATLPALSRAHAQSAGTAEPIIINTLGGLSNPNMRGPRAGRAAAYLRIEPRVIAEARASGITATHLTVGFVTGTLSAAFEDTVNDMAAADETIRAHGKDLLKVLSAADIERAHRERKIGVLYGVQNCAMLEDKAARVDIFADLGLRVFQLTYNDDNLLGGGSKADATGLTPYGREVIQRINARRCIVDVSHGSRQIGLDAVAASSAPIAITHTGCRALRDIPRNSSDDLLRAVGAAGGYVGIFTGSMFLVGGGKDATAADVARHIDHAVQVAGEDAVGIGTDNPVTGFDDVEGMRRGWESFARQRAASGVGSAGETSGLPFTPELQGPEQFRTLQRALRARGYTESRIEKVLGLNFLRYARRVWGA
jgi:membrane dipeptidase